MSQEHGKKKKPYVQFVIFGILSATSYVFLFMKQDVVIDYTTRGGIFAALPIAAAFYFSFVHGAFGSNLLSLLGVTPQGRENKEI